MARPAGAVPKVVHESSDGCEIARVRVVAQRREDTRSVCGDKRCMPATVVCVPERRQHRVGLVDEREDLRIMTQPLEERATQWCHIVLGLEFFHTSFKPGWLSGYLSFKADSFGDVDRIPRDDLSEAEHCNRPAERFDEPREGKAQ